MFETIESSLLKKLQNWNGESVLQLMVTVRSYMKCGDIMEYKTLRQLNVPNTCLWNIDDDDRDLTILARDHDGLVLVGDHFLHECQSWIVLHFDDYLSLKLSRNRRREKEEC